MGVAVASYFSAVINTISGNGEFVQAERDSCVFGPKEAVGGELFVVVMV